jgi:hypothetical protein
MEFPDYIKIQVCKQKGFFGLEGERNCDPTALRMSPQVCLLTRVYNADNKAHRVLVAWQNVVNPGLGGINHQGPLAIISARSVFRARSKVLEAVLDGRVLQNSWLLASVVVDGVIYPARAVPLQRWQIIYIPRVAQRFREFMKAFAARMEPVRETPAEYRQRANKWPEPL